MAIRTYFTACIICGCQVRRKFLLKKKHASYIVEHQCFKGSILNQNMPVSHVCPLKRLKKDTST